MKASPMFTSTFGYAGACAGLVTASYISAGHLISVFSFCSAFLPFILFSSLSLRKAHAIRSSIDRFEGAFVAMAVGSALASWTILLKGTEPEPWFMWPVLFVLAPLSLAALLTVAGSLVAGPPPLAGLAGVMILSFAWQLVFPHGAHISSIEAVAGLSFLWMTALGAVFGYWANCCSMVRNQRTNASASYWPPLALAENTVVALAMCGISFLL